MRAERTTAAAHERLPCHHALIIQLDALVTGATRTKTMEGESKYGLTLLIGRAMPAWRSPRGSNVVSGMLLKTGPGKGVRRIHKTYHRGRIKALHKCCKCKCETTMQSKPQRQVTMHKVKRKASSKKNRHLETLKCCQQEDPHRTAPLI